jgi:hypothetical protein
MKIYKGKAHTINGEVTITLHDCEDYDQFSVQITAINSPSDFYTTEVINGEFTVYGEGEFYYLVYCEEKNDGTFYPYGGF